MAVKKKIAEGIIDLVRSPFERAIGPDFDPRFDPRKKEQERLQELTVGVEPRSMDVPEISLQDLEGRPFITSMSDLTAAGGMLTDVRGRPLEVPVNLRGGQDFMFDETLNPGQVWASARGPSGAIMAAAKSIQRKTKEEPLFIPWRMAPSGGDFATMTGETMLSFAASNMSKAEKKALDKAIREYVSVGKMVKGKRVGAGQQIKGWKGVDDPSFAEVWRKTPDSLRKELMDKVMDKQFRNRGGLSIGEARLAVSDASQLSAREGGIQNVGRVFADGDRAIERSTHPSYPYAVPGEGVGRIKEDVNIFQLLPEVVEERRIADPLSPSRRDFRSMQMGAKTGTITPEILRNIFGGGAVAGVGTGLMAPEEAEAAGLGALIRRGIPESTARKIASGELPMDLGDRMERAREQRKVRRLYHAGSPELAESLQLDPDAGRFARAGSGTWMSPEPILANTYMPGDISEAGTMYQMVVDDSQFPTVFARGNNWDEVEGDLIGPDGEVILENVSGTTNDIARQVREMGYPGLIFNGITDVGPNYRAAKRSSEMIAEQYGLDPADMLKESIGDTADYEVYTVFDPSVARFPTAAFDPEQASSGNLMAGVGAGAVGAGLMASDEVSASPLDDPERAERRANARAVAVASDTLERLRRERGAVMSPLQDTRMARFGDYLTENRPSEMDPVQRALQSLGLFQGLGEYLRTTGEGQRTTTMQDINAALDVVPL